MWCCRLGSQTRMTGPGASRSHRPRLTGLPRQRALPWEAAAGGARSETVFLTAPTGRPPSEESQRASRTCSLSTSSSGWPVASAPGQQEGLGLRFPRPALPGQQRQWTRVRPLSLGGSWDQRAGVMGRGTEFRQDGTWAAVTRRHLQSGSRKTLRSVLPSLAQLPRVSTARAAGKPLKALGLPL